MEYDELLERFLILENNFFVHQKQQTEVELYFLKLLNSMEKSNRELTIIAGKLTNQLSKAYGYDPVDLSRLTIPSTPRVKPDTDGSNPSREKDSAPTEDKPDTLNLKSPEAK